MSNPSQNQTDMSFTVLPTPIQVYRLPLDLESLETETKPDWAQRFFRDDKGDRRSLRIWIDKSAGFRLTYTLPAEYSTEEPTTVYGGGYLIQYTNGHVAAVASEDFDRLITEDHVVTIDRHSLRRARETKASAEEVLGRHSLVDEAEDMTDWVCAVHDYESVIEDLCRTIDELLEGISDDEE